MEIEGSDGSKTQLKPYSTTVFGRGNGYPNDLAVSRRHISFELNLSTDPPDSQTDPRVSFEVLGKNPVWVFSKKIDGKIRVFKRFQRGELGFGDKFCLSPKDPVWFTVKEVEKKEMEDERESKRGEIEGRVNDELSQSLEISYGVDGNGDFGLDFVDVSNIDPVQEFGFLVIGHEFDHYPKQMIRDVKNWDWFLEDPRRDSDDEEEKGGRRGGRRGKRKKTKGDDDVEEEWTGESEDEEIVTTKARKVQRPTYQTRSKDRGKPNKERKDRKASTKSSSEEEEEEEEYEEDEEDETLGGFIVEDETVEEDEDAEDEEEEEEEEEFVEDEEELED